MRTRRLFRCAQRITGDAAAHVLKACRRARDWAATALAAAGNGELAQNVVLHEREKLVYALVLVMVRIDIDDQDISSRRCCACFLACASRRLVLSSSTATRRPRSAIRSMAFPPAAGQQLEEEPRSFSEDSE